ncbi:MULTISPECIES: ATPase [unclassified Microbacterium]|uniref:ATPase n=1 Tax=unclassified Microbacterium TaxID=2609290 RepID=UPI00386FC52E
MKKALWFVMGLAGGFVAAHLVNKDPRGQELLGEIDLRISEFTDRIADAYHAQEARIEGLVADAKDGSAGVADALEDAAAHAADTVTTSARSAAAKLTD